MLQPPLCLKIWRVVLSDVLYWICPKHNALYSGHEVNLSAIVCSFFLIIFYLTPFSPQFRGIQLLVATILSHRYNSRTGLGETKVESHTSSDTQPNQAAMLLNTARIQPSLTNVSEETPCTWQPWLCPNANRMFWNIFHSAQDSFFFTSYSVQLQPRNRGLGTDHHGSVWVLNQWSSRQE